MKQDSQLAQAFLDLVKIVERLRGPEGCPWDREQTHQSLTRYALEEAAEFVHAVEQGDYSEMCGELGDLLFQVVLNAEISKQSGQFELEDVIRHISTKMIRRHPHVFAQTKVHSTADVIANWEIIKAQEKTLAQKSVSSERAYDLLSEMPKTLSALLVSQKIGDNTQKVSFDWSNANEVMVKVLEEVGELKKALDGETRARQLEEAGDLLFSVVQLIRHLSGDAEQTLRETNYRFASRFQKMMESIQLSKKDPQKLSGTEWDCFWRGAKEN